MKEDQPDFILGLDLGQASDPTALAVLERSQRPDPEQEGWYLDHFGVRHLQRWPLGTSYPAIIEDLKGLVSKPPLKHCLLAVDQTGVGRAVVDMIRQANLSAWLRPILITAGHAVTTDDDGAAHVPKKELVSVLQALLQTRRLKIAPLPERAVLVEELLNFKVKITASANETFEAWRERDHDDLVLAVALACWLGDRGGRGSGPKLVVPEPIDRTRDPLLDSMRWRGNPLGWQ